MREVVMPDIDHVTEIHRVVRGIANRPRG